MSGFQGADTQALQRMGSLLEDRSSSLEDMTARLGALINAVPWVGPDAMALRADWAFRIRPRLVDCHLRLREEGRSLRDHAEEQDQASDPAGDVAGGGSGADSGRGTDSVGGPDGLLRAVSTPQIALAALSVPLDAASGAASRAGDAIGDTVGTAAEPGAAGIGLATGPGGGVRAFAQQVSDAIGTDSPLEFDGTGLVLEPPRTSDTVTVDAGRDLAPSSAAKPFGIDADGTPIDLAPNTKYEVGDHGTYYTDGDGTVVYIEATGGGEAMNPNLREVFPDANYHVNANVFYSTDELGRLDHMYVPEVELHPDTARSESIQSKIADRFDMTANGETERIEYNAGHALARQFGGVREEINYTRQWDDVNQARKGVDDNIYAYESLMADGIADHGHAYTYETRFNWGDEQPPGVGPDQGSAPWEYVPGSYDVRITENGEEIADTSMPNYPDGATFDK